ncbi:MAG: ATP phosphoribosyltransferase regulatory subunit [Planctomycetota bacterium]|nr:ATP phosphoribosyltransferase regulatory subunit [Planctomycetota bacterium]
MGQHQAPTGTRDLYPMDAARRRFIMDSWRSSSVRHGFEEVDGPTFEHLDLYTVKSGEGIVSELFSFQRTGGEKTYALRPEFTPTLARLYAARAGSLPKPTKWFMAGPFFRAERPQRGRLREFLQWNVDFLGLAGDPKTPAEVEAAKAAADAEVIAACVSLLAGLGLTPRDVRVRVNHRAALSDWLVGQGVAVERQGELFALLDKRGKISGKEFAEGLAQFGFSLAQAEVFQRGVVRVTVNDPAGADEVLDLTMFSHAVMPLAQQLAQMGIVDWIDFDLTVVRGLAYYTGMVFEVHEAGGQERAIAGGGRYDGLVELFGGPSTPAVGFGMGDVVLGLVLADRGLMPDDAGLMEKAGLRPDAFVLSNGSPEAEQWVRPLVARLRGAGLHARHSYKATKNIGKLIQDANGARARYAVIIESPERATLKDLATGTQETIALADVDARVARR